MQLNDNQFYTGLTNLALYVAMYATNRSNRTKSLIDTFTSESLDYGDTKIFRSVPFPQVGDYSPNSSILGNHTPQFVPRGGSEPVNAVEETLKIDNFKLIKNTINRYMLEMAVKSEYGISDFIAIVMGNIEAAKNDYLYDMLINQLFDAVPGATEDVALIDAGEEVVPTQIQAAAILNQKNIALKIQYVIDSLTHYSTNYNEYGLKQSVDMQDLRLIMIQPYQNQAVVDLFAQLLNSKYINEKFPQPDLLTVPELKASQATHYNNKIVGFVMHKAAIQMFYKLVYMGEFFDPSTLRVNNFLHFWYGVGQVKQLPMVKIVVN